MTLTSGEIKEGGTIANEQVFKGFGCTGKTSAALVGFDLQFHTLAKATIDRDLRPLRRSS